MQTKKQKPLRAVIRDAAEYLFGVDGRGDCNPDHGGPTHTERLPVTSRAFAFVYAIDTGLVGTPDYMGLAYWWGHEYKHTMRDATPKQRKRAHDAILAAGLPLNGVSDEHAEIIARSTRATKRKVAR